MLREMPPLWREYADKAPIAGARWVFRLHALAILFRMRLLHGRVSGCSS